MKRYNPYEEERQQEDNAPKKGIFPLGIGRALIIVFFILVCLAAIDKGRFDKGKDPVFAREYEGTKYTYYLGIGYRIMESKDQTDKPTFDWFWEY